MPRKGPIRPRPIIADPVYSSILVQRFINRLMLDGKKSVAERIFYGAMEQLENPRTTSRARAVRTGRPKRDARDRGASPARRWIYVPGAC